MVDTIVDVRKKLHEAVARCSSCYSILLNDPSSETVWVSLRQELETTIDNLQWVRDWVDEKLR